jgi:hypothetical protein
LIFWVTNLEWFHFTGGRAISHRATEDTEKSELVEKHGSSEGGLFTTEARRQAEEV